MKGQGLGLGAGQPNTYNRILRQDSRREHAEAAAMVIVDQDQEVTSPNVVIYHTRYSHMPSHAHTPFHTHAPSHTHPFSYSSTFSYSLHSHTHPHNFSLSQVEEDDDVAGLQFLLAQELLTDNNSDDRK